MHGLIIEWSSSSQHKVKYDSTCPDISHLTVIPRVFNNLRRDVVQGTTSRVHQVGARLQILTKDREAKIANFYDTLFV